MIAKLAVLVSCSFAPLLAQTTWIVNAGGGPGVSFLDLPSAVASPSVLDGDTILVQVGPFGEGATPFVTTKGLTIVGVGGQVPIHTDFVNQIAITSLPATSTFRMAGFTRPTDGELNFYMQSCAGTVHLENLHARSPGALFPPWPSIVIDQCASVTMRDVENFGTPAVQVNVSRVSLVSCRLGLTSIGTGGGTGLTAWSSTVDVVQPWFEPAWALNALGASNSVIRIAGDGNARLAGGQYAAGGAPIATAGTTSVTIDPAVPTPTYPPNGPVVIGTATPVYASVPASWTTSAATPGQALSIRSTAAAGAIVFQALGAPGPLAATPLGTLGIDPLQPYAFFPPAIVPNTGAVTNTVGIPSALPLGLAFATQSVVWNGALLQLGSPATFVVH